MQAHRATLEAHLADTKKRRADAAAEAQKAEVAAQEATAARRAALESEALEALLDKCVLSLSALFRKFFFFTSYVSKRIKACYILLSLLSFFLVSGTRCSRKAQKPAYSTPNGC